MQTVSLGFNKCNPLFLSAVDAVNSTYQSKYDSVWKQARNEQQSANSNAQISETMSQHSIQSNSIQKSVSSNQAPFAYSTQSDQSTNVTVTKSHSIESCSSSIFQGNQPYIDPMLRTFKDLLHAGVLHAKLTENDVIDVLINHDIHIFDLPHNLWRSMCHCCNNQQICQNFNCFCYHNLLEKHMGKLLVLTKNTFENVVHESHTTKEQIKNNQTEDLVGLIPNVSYFKKQQKSKEERLNKERKSNTKQVLIQVGQVVEINDAVHGKLKGSIEKIYSKHLQVIYPLYSRIQYRSMVEISSLQFQ